MDKVQINAYHEIRTLTYDIVENLFIASLKNRLPKHLTFKDMTVMYFINQQCEAHTNTALEIAKSLSMEKNTFSNRLKRLEKEGIIIKASDLEDQRKVRVELSSQGQQYLNEYIDILNGFTTRLKKTFPPFERLRLAKAMAKSSNAITQQSPIQLSLLRPLKFKSQMREILSRIYDDTIKEEEHHIERRKLDALIIELRVLIEIYLDPTATQKSITETFKVTQSTLMSLMMRLEKRGWMIKKPDPKDKRVTKLQLTPIGHEEAEAFINHRLMTQEKMVDSLSPPEQTLIYKAFQTLKSYAEHLS
jgi:DNA-binding MarR family transcriptional regulator